jgi:hypothetical protein
VPVTGRENKKTLYPNHAIVKAGEGGLFRICFHSPAIDARKRFSNLHARLLLRIQFVRLLKSQRRGEVSERFKEHAWKACVGETQPWVRIPPSPPTSLRSFLSSHRSCRNLHFPRQLPAIRHVSMLSLRFATRARRRMPVGFSQTHREVHFRKTNRTGWLRLWTGCWVRPPPPLPNHFYFESVTCELQYRTVYRTDWFCTNVFHSVPLRHRNRVCVNFQGCVHVRVSQLVL